LEKEKIDAEELQGLYGNGTSACRSNLPIEDVFSNITGILTIAIMGQFLKKIFDRFIRIRGRPREIALGFALGLLIGFSPTMGFQVAMAIFMAAVLKWNKIAAAVGVQVTNPLTAPFIYGMTYVIGATIIGVEKRFVWSDALSWSGLIDMIDEAPRIFAALTIGGILIGIPVAVAGYFLSFAAVDRYQRGMKAKFLRQKDRLKAKVRSNRVPKKRPGKRTARQRQK
jgi:uncharacterized protein (DUF2062 family)